tara:strand:+ start:40389 stop:41306 length:918 start_codon:yes stop_codon:yes gene_type:complete
MPTDTFLKEVMRPSVYKKRTPLINHVRRIVDSCFENDESIDAVSLELKSQSFSKETLNSFLSKALYLEALMRVAYAEERLSQAYTETPQNQSDIQLHIQDLKNSYENIKKKRLHTKDNGAFIDSLEVLSLNPPKKATQGHYMCYNEVQKLLNALESELIAPALLILDATDSSNCANAIQSVIINKPEKAIPIALKSLKNNVSLNAARDDFHYWPIYNALLRYSGSKHIVNSEDFRNFLCCYIIHYNSLDCVLNIGLQTKAFKEVSGTLQIGQYITAKVSALSKIKEVRVNERAFTISDTQKIIEI